MQQDFKNGFDVQILANYYTQIAACKIQEALYWNGQLVWTPALGLYL